MLDLTSFKKSIYALDKLIIEVNKHEIFSKLDTTLQDGLKSGVIQNFEVTYELAWKMIKRWLEQNFSSDYVAGVTRRELFRLARESLLISDVDKWVLYHKARNETSHTYDAITADEVFIIAQGFIHDAKKLLVILESKND
ncbi:MAG: nucleotidyltransferase substrate binding protein [Burkholderiales bacterium]|nr:nucleotidyltransferase substrate binding protein [Burkholderiales bacterium]